MVGRGLPEHKVTGIFFIGSYLNTGASQHIVQGATGELAVVFHGLNIEQHMALLPLNTIIHCIGVPLLHQARNHTDHLRDMLGGVGNNSWRQVVESLHILKVGLGIAGRQHRNILTQFGGGVHNLIVNIGDIAGVLYFWVEGLQHPEQRIKDNSRSGIANMDPVVDRWSTDIHGHPLAIDWLKGLLAACQCVVEG